METTANLLSSADAAKYIGIGNFTFNAMLKNGDGPPYLLLGAKNGRRKFRTVDLDAWLESRKIDGKPTKAKLRHIKAKV